MSEKTPCIVGMQSCGCITYVNARPDDLDREDQKSIARIVGNGGQVIRTTVGEARTMPHFLPNECPHDPKGWEREPYVDPSKRISVKYRNSFGASTVYRGWERVGQVLREQQHSGSWLATPGWFGGDRSARDGADVLGPFRTRAEAVDALASGVTV